MSGTERPIADRRLAREAAQDALLDAAERLAGIDGAASLSLKRLADEAGVSTMVIYSRFGDRYGLEAALFERALGSLIEAINGAGDSFPDVADALRTWALERPSRFSLLFVTSHLLDPALHAEVRAAIERAAGAIEQRAGWSADDQQGRGLVSLAAVVGLLTFELRRQVHPGDAGRSFALLTSFLTEHATA